jgi:hypothetical protein
MVTDLRTLAAPDLISGVRRPALPDRHHAPRVDTCCATAPPAGIAEATTGVGITDVGSVSTAAVSGCAEGRCSPVVLGRDRR